MNEDLLPITDAPEQEPATEPTPLIDDAAQTLPMVEAPIGMAMVESTLGPCNVCRRQLTPDSKCRSSAVLCRDCCTHAPHWS